MEKIDTSTLNWVKSSFSGSGQCCEAAHLNNGTAFRDSKNPNGGTVIFTHGNWKTFINGVKLDKFN
ncbi:DUF397 domain-containing protein [Actinokineospora auranticolor]|uniref:Uncharacterized protein DUF397 n=1 Tax=Actinokineospora auranticolor TaxID=155976 RepID=A0A2S6GMZ4_9PSEU|nr:DUF397 domain-containing protein [Actinokineospora auranticolor]PPK66543.1 uncharacterized protein DUF397 [Actinokineospora auranticolor]